MAIKMDPKYAKVCQIISFLCIYIEKHTIYEFLQCHYIANLYSNLLIYTQCGTITFFWLLIVALECDDIIKSRITEMERQIWH